MTKIPLFGLAMMIMAAPALAQDAPGGPALAPDEEIVVEAPRVLPPPPSPSAFTRAPVIVTKVTIPVLYDDLDLKRPEHAERLMVRVERVAYDACKHLDEMYPLTRDPDCVTKTIHSATIAAERAIAAARR